MRQTFCFIKVSAMSGIKGSRPHGRSFQRNDTRRARREYKNGYLPKIAFHIFQKDEEKTRYFMQRQVDTYGELTPKQTDYIKEEVMRLCFENEIEEHV